MSLRLADALRGVSRRDIPGKIVDV